MRSDVQPVRDLVRHLRALNPVSITQVSLVGLMAGALYSLLAAAELDYDDTRAFPTLATFAGEFNTVLDSIDRDQLPPRSWLAGFYFHSALMRLDAIDSRLEKVLSRKPAHGSKVRAAVNALKHDIDAHLSAKTPVVFGDAVLHGQRLVADLQQMMPSPSPTAA
jgi:hypothetical protein